MISSFAVMEWLRTLRLSRQQLETHLQSPAARRFPVRAYRRVVYSPLPVVAEDVEAPAHWPPLAAPGVRSSSNRSGVGHSCGRGERSSRRLLPGEL